MLGNETGRYVYGKIMEPGSSKVKQTKLNGHDKWAGGYTK